MAKAFSQGNGFMPVLRREQGRGTAEPVVWSWKDRRLGVQAYDVDRTKPIWCHFQGTWFTNALPRVKTLG
jgi:hypothetical protein